MDLAERQVRVLVGELLRSDNQGLSQEQVLQRHADTVRKRLPDDLALQAELYGLLATTFGDMGLSHLAVQHGARQVELLVKIAAPQADRVQALLQLGRAQLDNQQLGEAARGKHGAG